MHSNSPERYDARAKSPNGDSSGGMVGGESLDDARAKSPNGDSSGGMVGGESLAKIDSAKIRFFITSHWLPANDLF